MANVAVAPVKASVPVPESEPAVVVCVPPEKASVAGLVTVHAPVCVPPPLKANVPLETPTEPLLLKVVPMYGAPLPELRVSVPLLLNVAFEP